MNKHELQALYEVPELPYQPTEWQQQFLATLAANRRRNAEIAVRAQLLDHLPDDDDDWRELVTWFDRLGLDIFQPTSAKQLKAAWRRWERSPPSGKKWSKQDRESLTLAAIAYLLANNTLNTSEIARHIGVPRKTLMSWPKFKAYIENARKAANETKADFPRGRKSAAGDIEAWK